MVGRKNLKLLLLLTPLLAGFFVVLTPAVKTSADIDNVFLNDSYGSNDMRVGIWAADGVGTLLDAQQSQFRVFKPAGNNSAISIKLDGICSEGKSIVVKIIGDSGYVKQVPNNCSGGDVDFNIPNSSFSQPAKYGGSGSVYKSAAFFVKYTNNQEPASQQFTVRASPVAKVTFDDLGSANSSSASSSLFRPNCANPTAERTNPNDVNLTRSICNYPDDSAFSVKPATGEDNSFRIRFTPDCTYDGNSPVYLKWFDADVGTSYGHSSQRFKLRNISNGGNVIADVSGKGNLGGEGSYAYKNVGPLNVGDTYEWEWTGISSGNGVQIWMPFPGLTDLDCTDWDLQARTELKGTGGNWTTNDRTAKDTETVPFRHDIQNLGKSKANYSWSVEGRYISKDGSHTNADYHNNNKGGNLADGNLPANSVSNAAKGSSHPDNLIYNYKFPSWAKAGDKYCQRIEYTNPHGKGTGPTNTGAVCITLRDFQLSCSNFQITNVGGHIGPSGTARSTRTKVTFSGIGSSRVAPYPPNTSPSSSNYVPSINGEPKDSNTVGNWNLYSPTTTPVTITVDRQYYNGTSWISINGEATYEQDCPVPAAASCVSGPNQSVTNLQPGDGTDITMAVSGDASKLSGTILLYKIDGGAYQVANLIYASGSSGTIVKVYRANVPGAVLTAARQYSVTWYSGEVGASTLCSGNINVYSLPYFKAYEGSIRAGGHFDSVNGTDDDTGADSNFNGLLQSYSDNTVGYFKQRGSGTNLSALASILITGVASADGRFTSKPNVSVPSTGLSFANTGTIFPVTYDTTSPLLGGEFGNTDSFYEAELKPGTPTTPLNAGIIGIGNLGSGTYVHNGNLGIFGGSIAKEVNGDGKKITIYVNGGDVHIAQFPGGLPGIDYGAGWDGVYAANGVPSFQLVVTGGNIYIDPAVTELHGTYIAKRGVVGNTPKGGTIYTCSNSGQGGVLLPRNRYDNYANTCNKQLHIWGSFVAEQVNLMRTYGTLKNSTYAEPSNGSNAAEVFHYSPFLYVAEPAGSPASGGALQYDTITSLPPVL